MKKTSIALADEKVQGEPLLVKVMEKGKIIYDLPSLNAIRAAAAENLSKLPDGYKALTDAPVYPVELSKNLQKLIKNLKHQLTVNEINPRPGHQKLTTVISCFFVLTQVIVSSLLSTFA